jgi:16S rRNA (guanine527-N7)-methyltransferase
VFGDRLPVAMDYAELLVTDGIERGLIGPAEAPRIWSRHILNCAVIHPAIPAGSTVADIGSGAGLPGVVLSIVRPDLDMTLVEPTRRRADFLAEVAAELGLAGVVVRRARAEELAGELHVDVVTARAVAPMARLAQWALPLLNPGGRLLAVKGRSVHAEIERAVPILRALDAASWDVTEYGSGVVDPPTRVAVVEVGTGVRQAGPRPRTKGRT